MAGLLKKYVDVMQWDAEDIVGRLGIVLHAAFLFAGFQPYGAQPRSGHLLKKQSRKKGGSQCLSRKYTAPDLAHRDGADAAVLMLFAQGRDVVLLVFLTTDGGDRPENAYRERLYLETVSPLLCRSFRDVEPWASRICKSLADGVCWGFLDELCRRNGLPLSSFASLPDDLKGSVLEKLTDGKDLARVECVSSLLRLLVAERDHELWRTLYQSLRARQRQDWSWFFSLFLDAGRNFDKETLNLRSSWKDKYVDLEARLERHPCPMLMSRSRYLDFFKINSIQMVRRRKLLSMIRRIRMIRPIRRFRPMSIMLQWWLDFLSWSLDDRFIQDLSEEEEKAVHPRVDRSSSLSRRNLARNDYKNKWHGGGAIHSPSSRYRWKHR